MENKYLKSLKSFINEDVGKGDITSESIFPEDFSVEIVIIAKEKGILAGGIFLKEIYKQIDRNIKFHDFLEEGKEFKKNQVVGKMIGHIKSILKGERISLNLLSHISGIATLTSRFVKKTKGKISILDTRKTLPGLRYFEKYGVRLGGGKNHRMKMDELVLLKDNHINAWMQKNKTTRIDAINQLKEMAKKTQKA